MAWTSADTNAQLASERPAPTPEQQRFDEHAYAVTKLVKEMRDLTQTGMYWPTFGEDRISRMVELASDLRRELSVLAIEGARPDAARDAA